MTERGLEGVAAGDRVGAGADSIDLVSNCQSGRIRCAKIQQRSLRQKEYVLTDVVNGSRQNEHDTGCSTPDARDDVEQ